MGLLIILTQLIYAQESPAFEKIRDISPDGKFAVRILCNGELGDPDKYIDPNLITDRQFRNQFKEEMPSME